MSLGSFGHDEPDQGNNELIQQHIHSSLARYRICNFVKLAHEEHTLPLHQHAYVLPPHLFSYHVRVNMLEKKILEQTTLQGEGSVLDLLMLGHYRKWQVPASPRKRLLKTNNSTPLTSGVNIKATHGIPERECHGNQEMSILH